MFDDDWWSEKLGVTLSQFLKIALIVHEIATVSGVGVSPVRRCSPRNSSLYSNLCLLVAYCRAWTLGLPARSNTWSGWAGKT